METDIGGVCCLAPMIIGGILVIFALLGGWAKNAEVKREFYKSGIQSARIRSAPPAIVQPPRRVTKYCATCGTLNVIPPQGGQCPICSKPLN